MGGSFCGERKRNQPSSEGKGFCLSGNRYIHLHLPPIGALKKIIIDSKKCWESSGRGPALDNFPGCPIWFDARLSTFHTWFPDSTLIGIWVKKIWAPCWMALAQLPLSCWFNCSFDDLIPNSLVSKAQTRLQHHCPWPSMTIHDHPRPVNLLLYRCNWTFGSIDGLNHAIMSATPPQPRRCANMPCISCSNAFFGLKSITSRHETQRSAKHWSNMILIQHIYT